MATSKPKRLKPKNKKTKTFLEFDEKARSEYLKGFHKRKIERKKVAREKQDEKILAERKEILKQARDLKNSHLKQNAIIVPEISTLVEPDIYDLPEHTVTIANIGDIDFVKKSGFHLGQNKGQNTDNKDDEDEETDTNKYVHRPKENKSIQQKLAACSNQLSSAKLNAKRMKKKHMLRQKFQPKKKGEKKKKTNKQ